MAEKQWTPQQRAAIEARGGTLLVSAAAGSGKTAVLVERVIGRILDPEHPVDADRLLIATFSNAAALEMKQRIAARLNTLLAQHPEDARLQRQQMLLARAQIGTIHAFCGSLIRSNFQALGLPSNIRVADEKELEVLRQQAARQVVEEFHSRGEETFLQLVELLSSGRDDSRLFSTLFSLYDFVRSHPFYGRWLEEKLALYSGEVRVEDSAWGQVILSYAADALDYAIAMTGQALEKIRREERMAKAYLEAFYQDLDQLEQLRRTVSGRNWDQICVQLGGFTFAKLRPLRGEDGEKAAVQALRAGVKKLVGDLREKQFCATASQFQEDVDFLRPMVAQLFSLVQAFDRAFTAAKLQRNAMDFSDMEQYAIALLARPEGGGFVRTELARQVAAEYDELLIDEFQDTNAAQEIIFRAVSQNEQNLFLVGDVKQSIYRFRQARPELFLEKKRRYYPYDGAHFPAKITLGKNFRSAPQVTGWVNFLFTQLMSPQVGELDYDREEALQPGAVFPEGSRPACQVRILDLTGEEKHGDKTALEAREVAGQVARLLERGEPVADGDRVRAIRPSDICILLRSPARKAQVYLDALAARGIPVWAEPKNGFLTTREVAPVVALLRVLGNPLRDIDLTAALLSPLFGFTADELAAIRLVGRKLPFYLAVEAKAGQGDAHCQAFLALFRQLRRLAAVATADQVIREIYTRCDYLGKVQVMGMGDARRANLLQLVEYACRYHQSGYKGLSGFVGFVDQLLEREGDFAPASALSEQADVVRVMSIHRSKGLEFPVVFLCDCAKPFNREDLNGNTLLHSELGFACMRRDFAQMKQYTTVPMQALRLELERSMLSEELRMLYVALTRAKERLVITGALTRPGERAAALLAGLDAQGKLPAYLVRGASSYLDWVQMAAAHHPAFGEQLSQWGLVPPAPAAEIPEVEFTLVRAGLAQAPQPPQPAGPEPGQLPALEQALAQKLAWRYPHQALTRVPTKLAVSQIAKGELAQAHRFASRPAFLQEGGLTGAQKGNALHKFMQFADYRRAAQDVEAELARMGSQGFLTSQEVASIDPQRLQNFFTGPLAARIFRSPQVWRELRFLAQVGQETLGPYTSLLEEGGETVVQGVADCVFLEDGAAVVVDYKSDRVQRPEQLLDRYRTQLELYRRLLGSTLGVPVKECVLYSFALDREIRF